jgi:transcriptional regulator with XRE-family HTH domain
LKSVHTKQYAALLEALIGARSRHRLNQRALAKLLRKPQTYVSKYERGERRMDIVELIEICKALNIAPAALIRKVEGKPR